MRLSALFVLILALLAPSYTSTQVEAQSSVQEAKAPIITFLRVRQGDNLWKYYERYQFKADGLNSLSWQQFQEETVRLNSHRFEKRESLWILQVGECLYLPEAVNRMSPDDPLRNYEAISGCDKIYPTNWP